MHCQSAVAAEGAGVWPNRPRRWLMLAGIVLFPIAWVALHKIAILMNVGPGVSLWYPPAGLSFALLLAFPRLWPLVYVGIGFVVATGAYTSQPVHILLSWLIPPSGYIVGAWVLRRGAGGKLDLARSRHVHLFLAAALLVPFTVALFNVLNFCVDGVIPWNEYPAFVFRFFLGDAVGVATLAPILLFCADLVQGKREQLRPYNSVWRLFAAVVAAVLLISVEIYAMRLNGRDAGLSYFVLLPVAWAALAHGFAGAALAGALINISVLFGIWLSGNTTLAGIVPYLAISVAFVGLEIAAMVEDRERTLTKLRRHQAALEKASIAFASSESAAKLTHELRQPLAALSTYVHGLRALADKRQIDMGQHQDLPARLKQELERLEQVIASTHRLGEGMRRIDLDLVAVLRDASPLLHQLARDAGVKLSLRIASGPMALRGDAVLLQQALVNLVRNACEAAGRRVVVTCAVVGTDAVVSIEDDGVGFDQSVLQAGMAFGMSNKQGGSGIGLPIARTVIAGHGGSLTLANDPHGGGLATVRLPLFGEDE